MDLTLREGYWIQFCMKLIDTIDIPQTLLVTFISLLVNWYNNGLLPLIRKFFLTPNRIIDFMDLRP
jgi:hypothetical protein